MICSCIGFACWVLYHKLWGRVPVNGRPRSEAWWRKYREDLINQPATDCAPIPHNKEISIYEQH